jgi:hypothetical protein
LAALLLAGFRATLATAALWDGLLLVVFVVAGLTGALRGDRPSTAVAESSSRGAFLTLGRAVFPLAFGLTDAFAFARGVLEDLVVAGALGRWSLATARAAERFFAAMNFSLFLIVVDDNGAALRLSRVCGCSDGVLGTPKL